MKILPPSQIDNLPILEAVLEELRLNVLDRLFYVAEALDLYSLDTDALKKKLGLLGFSSITIGKFISLDISSSEYEFISPYFYKSYRRLNQHRGSKQSIDFILHSAGLMNTLVRSNTQFYSQDSIFTDNNKSFFDFNSFRDNQVPELNIPDGYIIVPYTTNNLKTLKDYLASNPIIFSFLPAGYTFIFLSDFRTQFSNGVYQYDNLLSYDYLSQGLIGESNVVDPSDYSIDHLEEANRYPYPEGPLFHEWYYGWEPFTRYYTEETAGEGKEEHTIVHSIYYYDPFQWRDRGEVSFHTGSLRYRDSSRLYDLPYEYDGTPIKHIKESDPGRFGSMFDADVYIELLAEGVDKYALDQFIAGYEAFLNNALPYPDLWVGDYLVPALEGEERLAWYLDHVLGIKPVQSPSHSFASMFARGASMADNYWEREGGIVSKYDSCIQGRKKGIISDRQRLDMFQFHFAKEYSIWLDSVKSANKEYAANVINTALADVPGWNAELSPIILARVPSLLLDCVQTFGEAEAIFNSLTVNSTYGHDAPPYGLVYEVIFEVKDGSGTVVLTNRGHYEAYRPSVASHAHEQASRSGLGLVQRVYPDAPFDLYVPWGDPVTVPSGFRVSGVSTTRAYAKFASYSRNTPLKLNVTAEGDFEYVDSLTASELSLESDPCLQVAGFSSDALTSGRRYTSPSTKQRPRTITGISVNTVFAYGFLFDLTVTFDTHAHADTYVNSIQASHSLFYMEYYDENGELEPYALKAPSSSWSFSGGTFVWSPPGEEYSPIWLYYQKKTVARIHCVPDT